MKNSIPVLEKAAAVLKYIGAHPGRVTRPELSDALGISQPTCYRIVETLVENNFLIRSGREYDISTGIVPVARKAELQLEKYAHLRPALENLASKAGYSVKLSVPDGEEHVNVVCAKAPWDVALTAQIGSRAPLLVPSSVSTVLLSDSEGRGGFSPEFRKKFEAFDRDGFCFNPGSKESSARWRVDALSVAVRDSNGKIVGALTLLSIPGDLERADLKKLSDEMKPCAKFCSSTLG